jgi:hypothetical protein
VINQPIARSNSALGRSVGSWAPYGLVIGGEISEFGKPGVMDCSEGRKEGVIPFDHGGMGEDRITEFGRGHSRNHECLHVPIISPASAARIVHPRIR